MDPVTSSTKPGSSALNPISEADANKNSLGKDAFLKLLTTQLQHQDPLNPMDDSQFMGQMAQFSTLEQVTNMANANTAMADNLAFNKSVSLIGRTVTYTGEDDQPHTGKVDRVTTTDGKPALSVGGTDGVDPSSVTEVL
jgi:flagellar basal-body rod modification protein FlgD